jgi:hypothetical protein
VNDEANGVASVDRLISRVIAARKRKDHRQGDLCVMPAIDISGCG